MKRARVLVLGIAVLAAGGAALLAKGLISSPQKVVTVEKDVSTTEVLVAAKDINLGDSVHSKDLKWQPWPKDAAVKGYVTRQNKPKALSDFSGAIARAPFLAGEPITNQKLIKKSDGGVMAAILPSGMRAISTPIREETAAGGFILPTDRVDVIVTRRLKTALREEHVSDTVLRNVRVLAIGQNIEQKGDKKVANGKTATLELTPRQTELLTLAQSMGDISLALRSLADANPGNKGPESADQALAGERGTSIKLMKYGVKSRAFGVN
ncbi:MAG: Flp pilus assembly protein CpaB [Methyloligellaceae bacterium]